MLFRSLGTAELSRDDQGIKYMLVGDGSVRQQLEQRAKSAQLKNLQFVPLLPDDQFLDLLAASDISLVTQQRSVADIVFPSKVITLMSAARAIIASVSAGSEVARVLKEADAGIVVAPENPGALLEAIRALRNNPGRRQQLGSNARAFAQRVWEKQRTLSTLESHLLRVAASRNSSPSPELPMVNEQLVIDGEESRR